MPFVITLIHTSTAVCLLITLPLSSLSSHSSPCGKKFRSKPQIAKFLGENHNLDLSCFDFSRGAYGEVTQRRRARDRQIGKKMESVKPIPVLKPLSVNPLRASGPIRRTCGVIKLPVTWVAPPDDDQGGTSMTNLTPLAPGEQKSQIHLIVQSLWEKRLFGVKPYNHVTGDEIANDNKVEVKPITPMMSKPHSPRTISPGPSLSQSPNGASTAAAVGNTSGVPIKAAPSLIPSSPFRQQQHQALSGLNSTAPPLLPTLLLSQPPPPSAKIREQQHSSVEPISSSLPASTSATPNFSVIQQTGQPIIVPQQASLGGTNQPTPSSPHHQYQRVSSSQQQHHHHHHHHHHRFSLSSARQFSNGISLSSSTKPPVAPVAPMVTDHELQLQEERVRLLRQQLLAAAGTNQRPSS